MHEVVLWTNLSRREISRRLAAMGTPASRYVVRKLLKKCGFGQRKACTKKSMGAHPDPARTLRLGAQRRVRAPQYQQRHERVLW